MGNMGPRNRSRKQLSSVAIRSQLREIQRDIAVDSVELKTPLFTPKWVSNPPVFRVVRLRASLTSVSGSIAITNSLVSGEDNASYGVSGPRYTNMRIIQVRAYIEDSVQTAAQVAAFGLVLTDAESNKHYQGQRSAEFRNASAGFQLARQNRITFRSVGDTTNQATVALDALVPTGTTIFVTIDVTVEFA